MFAVALRRLAVVLAAASLAVLTAQQSIGPDELRSRVQPYMPAPALTLRTQVQVVEVPVVVRDHHYRAVAGLSQSDFTVFDNNKKQEISNFSIETFTTAGGAAVPDPIAPPPTTNAPVTKTAPRYVALCFDDLTTDNESLMRVKAAAKQFVTQDLAPGDRVAVVTTAWMKPTEFTADVPTMLAIIDKVQANQRAGDSAGTCPHITPYEGYLIANHMDPSVLAAKVQEYIACAGRVPHPGDTIETLSRAVWENTHTSSKATLQAVDLLVRSLSAIPGRRMILLTSSGFLSGNLEFEIEDLIRKALRGGVVINSLGARGLYTVTPGGDVSTPPRTAGRSTRSQITEDQVAATAELAKDDGLAVLASGTGGMFFHNNNDLLHGFKEVGMVPEIMYVLSFTPNEGASDGHFHNLRVKLTSSKGYSVQARMGYNAPGKTPPAPAAPPSKIDTAMSATDVVADLPANITWRADLQKGGVTYIAHVDLNKLHFEVKQDRHVQQLTLVATLRDELGNPTAGERGDVQLNLTDATFKSLLAAGGIVDLTLTLKAPAGTYEARGMVLDGLDGKMAASGQQIQIQ